MRFKEWIHFIRRQILILFAILFCGAVLVVLSLVLLSLHAEKESEMLVFWGYRIMYGGYPCYLLFMLLKRMFNGPGKKKAEPDVC